MRAGLAVTALAVLSVVTVSCGAVEASIGSAGTEGEVMVDLLDNDRLSLTLWGSSSCPEEPYRVTVVRPNEVQVFTRADIPPSGLCTADSHGNTSVINLRIDRLDLSDGLWVEVHTGCKTHRRLFAE